MFTLQIVKQIINISKLDNELKLLNSKYLNLSTKGEELTFYFNETLIQEEIDNVYNLVNNFIEVDLAENLKIYVETEIKPFVDNLMYTIQAENIAMGITQAGKTFDVLGFFTEQIQLPNRTKKVSLKESMDSNSLTVTIELLFYFYNNPSLYIDLNPFITQERILKWLNSIKQKLGI